MDRISCAPGLRMEPARGSRSPITPPKVRSSAARRYNHGPATRAHRTRNARVCQPSSTTTCLGIDAGRHVVVLEGWHTRALRVRCARVAGPWLYLRAAEDRTFGRGIEIGRASWRERV